MTILIVYDYLNMPESAHPMHGTPINLLTTPPPPQGWQFNSMAYHAFK